jgi:hypothetical protein
VVTQETQGFIDRFRPQKDNSPMSCVLVLLMAIGVAVEVVDLSPRGASTPPFISKGGEVTRKVTESVTT